MVLKKAIMIAQPIFRCEKHIAGSIALLKNIVGVLLIFLFFVWRRLFVGKPKMVFTSLSSK